MNVVVCPDKFKGCITAREVASAVATGIKRYDRSAKVTCLPLADGGDGTLDVLQHYYQATLHYVDVTDPLGRPIRAPFALSSDNHTAIIELASASGIARLSPSEINPMDTSTEGTGLLIKRALDAGAREVIIGMGGSATHDGGTGLAFALGYRFVDKQGNSLQPGGKNLVNISRIDASGADERIAATTFILAADVSNPLTGPEGATRVYAEQKGARNEDTYVLESGLENLNMCWKKDLNVDVGEVPGSGAAGGAGGGAVAFLNARLKKGIDWVVRTSKLEGYIQQADLVITAEGKIDRQTLHGKVIQGVSSICKKAEKPLLALCGTLEADVKTLDDLGVTDARSLLYQPVSLAEALKPAYTMAALEQAAARMYRSFVILQSLR